MNKIDNFNNQTQNQGLDFNMAIPSELNLSQKNNINILNQQNIEQNVADKEMAASIIENVLPSIPKELLEKFNLEDMAVLQIALEEFLKNDPKLPKDLASMKEVLAKLMSEIKEQNAQENNNHVFNNNVEHNLESYNLLKDQLMQHLLNYPDSEKVLKLGKQLLTNTQEEDKTNLKSEHPKEKQPESNNFNINAGGQSLNWGMINNTNDIMLLIAMLFLAMADIPTNQALEHGRLFNKKRELGKLLAGGKALLDDIADMLPLSEEMYKILFGDKKDQHKTVAELLQAIREKYKNTKDDDEKKKLEVLNNKIDTFLKDFKKNTGEEFKLGEPDNSQKQLDAYFKKINDEYRVGNPDGAKLDLINLNIFKDVTSSTSGAEKSLQKCIKDVEGAQSDINSISSKLQVELKYFIETMDGFLAGATKNIQSYIGLIQTIYR